MGSGLPRHVHAGAHDSRQVLTFHVIYQLRKNLIMDEVGVLK